MENEKLELEIFDYLSTIRNDSKTDKINICHWLYQKIGNEPNCAPKALQYFFEISETIESKNDIIADCIISENDIVELERRYGNIVNAMFEEILLQNLSVSDFYTNLWEAISLSPSFRRVEARVFAIYYIWIDVRIPYFQLKDGLKMSDLDFQTITKSLRLEVQEARFIMNTNYYKQRTERASALLDLIESIKSYEEKTVLIAHILTIGNPVAIRSEAMKELLSRLMDT